METRDNSSPPLESHRPGDDKASQRGGGTGSDAKAAVEREMHDAKDRLSAAGRELRSEASGAADTISTMASDQAERQKGAAVDGLNSFAETIRRAADDLGANDRSMSARMVQEAAHSLERFSSSLQSRSVSDMTRSVTTFGRENPTAFLAGCLLAGVAVGRFLIASSERAHDERRDAADDDWQSGQMTGGGGRWPGDRMAEYPGTAAAEGAGMGTAGSGAAGIGGAGLGGAGMGAAGTRGAGMGGAGAGVLGGTGGGASGQAGTFGAGVAPSSAERAPGDLDAQGTMMDDPEPTLPSDSGLGERPGGLAGEADGDTPKPLANRGPGTGGRDGDL